MWTDDVNWRGGRFSRLPNASSAAEHLRRLSVGRHHAQGKYIKGYYPVFLRTNDW